MAQQEYISNQPIVIDNGTGLMKAGLAGVERPSCEFRSYVGFQKYDRVVMNGYAPVDNLWVGKDLETRRGLCRLEYPMNHGIVENWNLMEEIWKHIYSKAQLGLDSREHPVFLTQAAITPNKQTEKMAEFFFETIQAPAIFVAPQPLLSMYSSGRGTGVVVDIGEGVTTFFPVYDGYAITPYIRRVDLGGKEMTQYLQFLLRKSGHIFSSSSEFEVVREMKEACSECATSGMDANQRQKIVDYVLPDGNSIQIGEERWQCAEMLFDPHRVGSESLGIAGELTTTVMKCDMDLRKELFGNILLSGGVTLTRNFGKRLLDEVMPLAPSSTALRVMSPPDRVHSAWNGACVLTSLSPFGDMWVTNKEWEEEGRKIIHQKALLWCVCSNRRKEL